VISFEGLAKALIGDHWGSKFFFLPSPSLHSFFNIGCYRLLIIEERPAKSGRVNSRAVVEFAMSRLKRH
jgi:hypothetical protein